MGADPATSALQSLETRKPQLECHNQLGHQIVVCSHSFQWCFKMGNLKGRHAAAKSGKKTVSIHPNTIRPIKTKTKIKIKIPSTKAPVSLPVETEDETQAEASEVMEFEDELEEEYGHLPKNLRPRVTGPVPEQLRRSKWIPHPHAAQVELERQDGALSIAGGLLAHKPKTVASLTDERITCVPLLLAVLKARKVDLLAALTGICPQLEHAGVLRQILYWLDVTESGRPRAAERVMFYKTRAQLVDELRLFPNTGQNRRVKAMGKLLAELRECGYISTRIRGQGKGKCTWILVMVGNLVHALRKDLDPQNHGPLGSRPDQCQR